MIRRHLHEISVTIALALTLAFLAATAPAFFKPTQTLAVLTAAAPVLLAASGAAMIIIARQIDISIGSQFAWCSVLAALAAARGWPMPAVAASAIAAGAVLGAINGVFVAGLGLPSIVVTLATMVAWRETLRWWREGAFVRDLPPSFQWFGLSQAGGEALLLGIAALVFLFLVFALKHLAGGRFIYAVGCDAEAARLAGINPRIVTFLLFVLMGALTGLGALLGAVRFSDVDPKTGQGLELQAIAGAVVGGVAIAGGRGKLWGVLAGVLLLACIAPALVFIHVQPQWERAIQGAIILLSVAAGRWKS
jgi:rhamnose transport system permease protein